MRTFIAFDLPQTVKSEISTWIKPIKQPALNSSIKWVDSKNLHITLKFLGETTPDKINRLAEKINNQLHSLKPIPLNLSKPGAFPSIQKPNVIWIDVLPKERLFSAYKEIESVCISEGFEADQKPFKTHITLARIKRERNPAQIKQIVSTLNNIPPAPQIGFFIDHITIFQSVLTPQGPIYTALRRID